VKASFVSTRTESAHLWTTMSTTLVKLVFFGFIFGFSFYLFYNQAFHADRYLSDLPGHLENCGLLEKHPFAVPHPLFHAMVLCLSSLAGIGIEYSAVAVLAGITTALSCVIFWILKWTQAGAYTEIELLFVVFLMLSVSAIYVPGLVQNIYMGQGSPNVWHSATLLAVKPLAFLSVFLLFKDHDSPKRDSHYAIVAILTLLSIFAKPSFVMIFLPALWVFTLVKGRLADRHFLHFLLSVSVLSSLAVAAQFLSVYHGESVYSDGKTEVVLDFLGVWSLYTKNWPLSLVLGLAFPLLVALANPKRVYENDSLLICWLMTGFGIIMGATLAEQGPRYHHTNFMWSYRLSQQLIFLFSMAEFLRWSKESAGRVWYALTAGALALHVFTGIIYAGRIWTGESGGENPVREILAWIVSR
jgi:hypothetical protein